jgi:putative flavoprotein involved in K+ transport
MFAQETMQRHANSTNSERFDVMVIGGGQAGLSVGYYLAQRGVRFVILDSHARVGDVWRTRWDSLRLFSPACYSGLAGMPFPAPAFHFPTKDEMADYLEEYAAHFALPVRTGTRVERLFKEGGRFVALAGDRRFEADQVVVAMNGKQKAKIPAFASELDDQIVQLHSIDYHNPAQLQEGPVLIVGAGNSGADIALDVARTHHTWLAGRDTGHVPFRIESMIARIVVPILFRIVFHRVLTIQTPMGRKARAKMHSKGMGLIRVKPQDLAAAGVERLPKVEGVRAGLPLLEDGRVLDAKNVIWCTGYKSSFPWIDLPIFDKGEPLQERGIVTTEPGLYFVGLDFQYAASSSMIQGVGRDAQFIVDQVVSATHRQALHAQAPASLPA